MIAREIALRSGYLPGTELQTLYLGGGTPSLLDEAELVLLLETARTHFSLKPNAEITLEANPDDLDPTKLRELARAGINRLSIGIQSFNDAHLKYLHRVHSGPEAECCVKQAQDAGISNISIDLIYAIPAPDHQVLREDLERALALRVSHISAYCLTIEPQTVFGNWLHKKKIEPIDDDFAAEQFELLVSQLAQHGYEQYEISNFARDGQYSQHNTAYWQRRSYLGVGPSAHSYDGASRQYNVSHNAQYLRALQRHEVPATREVLSRTDQVNEYLLTGLRTKWGCRLDLLAELSEGGFLRSQNQTLFRLFEKGWLQIINDTLLLTEAGKLFADRVASELFLDSESGLIN